MSATQLRRSFGGCRCARFRELRRRFRELAGGYAYSVQETWNKFATKALILTRTARRAASPAGLQVSSRNLAHPRSVHETWNTRCRDNWLIVLRPTLVASSRNLENRQRISFEVSIRAASGRCSNRNSSAQQRVKVSTFTRLSLPLMRAEPHHRRPFPPHGASACPMQTEDHRSPLARRRHRRRRGFG